MNMSLINFTTRWVNGEITQGKIMIFFGVIFMIACYLIWRNGAELIKGMIIPMLLVIIVYIGYGSWLVIKKPQQLLELTNAYEQQPEKTQELEEERTFKEKHSYMKFKISWGVVLIIGLALLFITPKPYFRGLALGLLFFGVSALIVDTFFEHRVNTYYENIQILKSTKSP